ncbi:MAG: Fic family protein [Methylomonas sp.]|nr:Fic family protein [Methylomonas sp.]PPD21326.1 MAG: cell filamentation protein Fic [Methylomonas sp.]PPD26931.1 MAG: cell filamentation protein Fic [Methylomonas sp.]PPD38862.1 MAG: cell filamentation protein Fic [Methylomonas sp.]PPD41704.1 MAG: cell filamentation protein Fic [Methylomonas sp.]
MILTVETHRSGIFTFQTGLKLAQLQPLIDKIDYGHRLFSSLPLLPDVTATLEKETLLSSIHGTDTIEGGTLTEDEISQVIEFTQEITQEEHKRRISNLAQAYRFAENAAIQAPTTQHSAFLVSEIFILTLHRLISGGINDDRYQPGQYRDNPKGQITKVGDEDHGGIYRTPQAHIDIKLLLGKLIEWLNSDEICSLPSLIRAPLAHYYFERIHPFQDGNGRVGRLLEKTILIASCSRYASRGIDRYYLENIDTYFSAFNQARKQEKTRPDTCNQDFIEFVLKGFEISIERLHHRANQMMRHFLVLAWLGDLLRDKHINNRQHVILDYLGGKQETITLHSLKKMPWYQALYRRYSPATESRDWADLVNQGIITKSDEGAIRLNAFRH